METVRYLADFKNLDAIRELVGEAARRAGFDDREVYAIQLATDEACSNIIEHAYRDMPPGEIEISYEADEDHMTIVIHDHGRTFDLSAVPQPNLTCDLRQRTLGGLGVYFIQNLMDEVRFESSPQTGNTLTMIKRKLRRG